MALDIASAKYEASPGGAVSPGEAARAEKASATAHPTPAADHVRKTRLYDRLAAPRRASRRLRRFFGWLIFSSLTRRIVALNLAALVALVGGILYLNQFRAGLIEARVASLMTQGEIIAAAIAGSATVETDAIAIDPEKLLQLQAGESVGPRVPMRNELDFPINPERVGPVLRRLISPTKTRAQIFDPQGLLILDSRYLFSRGQVLRFNLPEPDAEEDGLFQRWWSNLKLWVRQGEMPLYREIGLRDGRDFSEVATALDGAPSSLVRVSEQGELIVSVAVPIQRFRAVLGALLLSTQGGDIDAIVRAERLAIVRVFLVAAVVTVLLSILLAGTVAGPVRRLAAAAERVQRGVHKRQSIPNFGERQDEIGYLAHALRDMTAALYRRMEATEAFAADVAHELKNPLTSLRSAVETLPLAKSEEARRRLLEVIQHDVRRLDRLITDISDASRLDAELARGEADPVDIAELLAAVVGMANERAHSRDAPVRLSVEKPHSNTTFFVLGNDSRLSQVINNLIDNARSFSPPGGSVRVSVRREGAMAVVEVDDDGPGIRDDASERIFERFYTDRPDGEGFGDNSGLGLPISKQIVEAHRGTIAVENRLASDAAGRQAVAGARFTIRLPALAVDDT